jgi:uncharacterized protein (TIGR02145 family)
MRNLALMWVVAGVAVALLAAGDGKPPVSTFTDKRDKKVYKIVKIGGQTWFAENLNYAAEGSRCYSGDVVFKVGFDTITTPEEQAYCAKYGHLYNWETAITACPAGTHLPTDKEWTTLVKYVGGSKTAGTKLKSTSGWNEYRGKSGNGTDEYSFSALPGGYHYPGTTGYDGRWWSATENDVNHAWVRHMFYGIESVHRCRTGKSVNFFSVRCVQDLD